jgi:Domain of unknown function (DUF4145)
MDWLTFIAEMTKALAWPLAALGIFLVLRKHLLARLPDLDTLEWKDFRFRFNQQVHEVASEARQALPEPEVTRLPPLSDEAQHLRLADLSPRAAILESWIALEDAAISALKRKGTTLTDRELQQPLLLVQALGDAGLLNPAQQQVVSELRNLRNAAAHATELRITPQTAREFVTIASAFERLLRAR